MSNSIQLTDSQKSVLQKYLLEEKGEKSWEDACDRVAGFVSDVEKTKKLKSYWKNKFLSILEPMNFVPGGSIIANCDHGTQGLMNCFVMSSEDNIQDIAQAVTDAILTTKFRGGIGINIGSEGQKGYIRPKGTEFSDGQSLGPCAVLDMISDCSRKLTTGNKARRGAFMFSMDWRHPDIWEFIQAKTESSIDAHLLKKSAQGELTQEEFDKAWVETHLSPEGRRDRRWYNANISVQVDDEFFNFLDESEVLGIDYPEVPTADQFKTSSLSKLCWAKALWNQIAQFAHDTADPGLLLVDNAKKASPIRDFILTTNPCVTADTWVHTGDGPRQVKDLIGQQHSTYVNGELFSTTPEGFFYTGNKTVYKLSTSEGTCLRLTSNHRVLKVTAQTRYKQYTDWVEVKDLVPGDKVALHNHRGLTPWSGFGSMEEGWLLGSLIGDGCFGLNNRGVNQGILSFWGENKEFLLEKAVSLLNEIPCVSTLGRSYSVSGTTSVKHDRATVSTVRLGKLAETFGVVPGAKTITPEVEQASFEFYQGFLRGIFDADGSVQGSQQKGISVRLAQSNLTLLEAVQRMLARVGVISTIYKNRRDEQYRNLPDGKGGSTSYLCQAQHELVIASDNIIEFESIVGFEDPTKLAKLQTLVNGYSRTPNKERFTATVESLIIDSIDEPVYDCTVPGPHRFDANGLVAHNCGELWLPKDSACNLGSIVISRYIQDGVINWDAIARDVHIAVRFLDNVLDASSFATAKQKESVQNKFRQIGLGIMGWADALKLLKISYDSERHLELIDEVGSFVAKAAYKASEDLAKEKGACGVWQQIKSVKTGNSFETWQTFDEAQLPDNILSGDEVTDGDVNRHAEQIPRRNSTVLSIAPTGSIAQLAGCSWAFEPDFGLSIWKQVYVDASKSQQQWVQILNPFLEDLNLSDEDQSTVLSTGSLQGTAFAKNNPEVAAAYKIAGEITPEWHVRVQSHWQKWIDSSISKTVNLPKEATVEEIKHTYRVAHKLGLKGITVYRSGTLESEPIKVGAKEEEVEVEEATNGCRSGSCEIR